MNLDKACICYVREGVKDAGNIVPSGRALRVAEIYFGTGWVTAYDTQENIYYDICFDDCIVCAYLGLDKYDNPVYEGTIFSEGDEKVVAHMSCKTIPAELPESQVNSKLPFLFTCEAVGHIYDTPNCKKDITITIPAQKFDEFYI